MLDSSLSVNTSRTRQLGTPFPIKDVSEITQLRFRLFSSSWVLKLERERALGVRLSRCIEISEFRHRHRYYVQNL